jgi:hypothetical protein
MRAGQKIALRDEVRDALLAILRDASSAATARASAARTLCEYFGEEAGSGEHKRAEEMTVDEIDREIASIQQRKR